MSNANGILSTDEIAALVEAAKHGQLPEQGAGLAQRRPPRLRTVDFSRPTKFTSDHQRRIARAIDTFCQTAVTRMSAELRWPIEMEAINTMQLTWSAAQSQLPPGAVSAIVEVQPINTRMLLTVEQSFMLMALECLLGGSPFRQPKERRFTEIDWALIRRFLESIVNQLSVVFEDLGGVTLHTGEVEIHHDGSQVASVSEPTYVVVIEGRINKQSSAIELLIPWVAIEPVAQRIAGRERVARDDYPDDAPAVEAALAAAPVTIRAEVASTKLAVQDILALKPGSMVAFPKPAEQGVAVFAENVKIAVAQPGSNGPRRAIQIRGTEAGAS
jgi:flagellar motor switch protein FliM